MVDGLVSIDEFVYLLKCNWREQMIWDYLGFNSRRVSVERVVIFISLSLSA